MPIPRYQPQKKFRPSGPSLDDLNDSCLVRIIGYALVGDKNAEKNLSLVSRRWYFLTQIQAANRVVHKINLNTVSKSRNPSFEMNIYRKLQPRLNKYKHVFLEGNISATDFDKLILALRASRIEQLDLRLILDGTSRDPLTFVNIPHLRRLTLHWTLDKWSSSIWRIYERATNIEALHVNATGSSTRLLHPPPVQHARHPNLRKLVFKRSPPEPECPSLGHVKNILQSEKSIAHLETDDPNLVRYLIETSDRVCTVLKLNYLDLSTPIRELDILVKLLQSYNLGTERLSVETDDIEMIEEVRLALEKTPRSCRLTFSFKDQKFTDPEEKIKLMTQLSRMAELTIKIEAQQRISIDCCHMIWSVGRALQGDEKCLFKITIIGINPLKLTEVTVPLGQCRNYSINSSREDSHRHREIVKSLKKDCYHQFVKSLRGNLTP